ncbi:methionyl-tRNA formyltransferase [Chromobacterium subtsugae]|uniref:methionyl-tRNA formyltransferase n=1 Tax=Chromobacterium subtsugae TaxID=251747 RepID=UPI00069A1C5E|nr:formyltransferase family protein [Chromobacterium subtsugae]
MKNNFKIALFANHAPGLHIAQYLATCAPNDTVCALYVSDEQKENDQEIIKTLNVPSSHIFRGRDIMKDPAHIQWFREQDFDAIVTVYWPWLLSKEVFSASPITVNFHPAMLPINRGWFPHVHSLIDGSKTGVTLHKIEDGADTGAIWAQKEVPIAALDTAKDIYDKLQFEIVELFKQKWPDIKQGKITPTLQDESQAVYHAKKEIEELDHIDLNQSYLAKDLINKLKARTFGNRGFAYYEENGEKIYVKISLSHTSKF